MVEQTGSHEEGFLLFCCDVFASFTCGAHFYFLTGDRIMKIMKNKNSTHEPQDRLKADLFTCLTRRTFERLGTHNCFCILAEDVSNIFANKVWHFNFWIQSRQVSRVKDKVPG